MGRPHPLPAPYPGPAEGAQHVLCCLGPMVLAGLGTVHFLCKLGSQSASPRPVAYNSSFSLVAVPHFLFCLLPTLGEKNPFIFSDVPVCNLIPVTSYDLKWLIKIPSHRLFCHYPSFLPPSLFDIPSLYPTNTY